MNKAPDIACTLKNKIIDVTTALFPAADIYLYGSRARGTHELTSDIDIALDAGTPLDRYAIYELKEVLLGLRHPYHIDIVDLNSISEEFKKVITPDLVLWKKNR
jgi:predicted nucleotidyltransferase